AGAPSARRAAWARSATGAEEPRRGRSPGAERRPTGRPRRRGRGRGEAPASPTAPVEGTQHLPPPPGGRGEEGAEEHGVGILDLADLAPAMHAAVAAGELTVHGHGERLRIPISFEARRARQLRIDPHAGIAALDGVPAEEAVSLEAGGD